jgi:hypothetical protein
MVEDLQGEMSNGLLRPLDQLAGIRFGKRHTKIFTCRLPNRLSRGVDNRAVVGITGKCVQVSSKTSKIFVSDIGLKSKLVL